jgi:aryl-alcohol dehydrogenase-like predicted oxidoreductase
MSTRTVGSLQIFPLALGGNVFGWTVDADHAAGILDPFTEGGGDRLIDTADVYPAWAPGAAGGDSERIIGDWLARRGRDRALIATKVAKLDGFRGLSTSNVRTSIENSLARLRTDHVDLYYAHEEDPDTPIAETAKVFSDLVAEGKIREIGFSNFSAESGQAWIDAARSNGWHAPVAMQPEYSLVERGYEDELAGLAQRDNLAVLPYYSLASGFLTGKYTSVEDGAGTARAAGAAHYATEDGLRIIDALREIAAAHRVQIASVSLAWLLAQPQIAAPIASASKPAQLEALLAAPDVQLSSDEVRALAAALAR